MNRNPRYVDGMSRSFLWLLITILIAGLLVPAAAQTKKRHSKKKAAKEPAAKSVPPARSATWKVAPDLDRRLARFQAVNMPFNQQGLSPKEVQLVNKLVEACRYLDSIYWRQSDPEGLSLLQQLQGSENPQDLDLARMLVINGSRYDLIENNKAFVGTDKYAPGHGLYPKDLTREEIEDYVTEHPATKRNIYNPYTVVRYKGDALEGVAYHIAYRSFLEPAAAALQDAADLSDDPAFAQFLRKRAEGLLSDDYYPSDLLWVDLKNPKFDVIFAPYETYLDEVLGIKGSYGASVLVRNEPESRKLDLYEKYVPEIQDALPLEAADKPSKRGQPTPMEVMDAPYRSGDLLHGYQAVADNLPNDPRIHAEKGTKKIFFKNFMDARVQNVVLPLARRMMRPDQAAQASAEGYLVGTVLHEIAHGLGPAYSRTPQGQRDIREALGPIYSGLEEAKADITGMYAAKWLVDKGALPKSRIEEYYASYLADIFRTVRFGVAEAHGQAVMMEFNFLVEQGAVRSDRGAEPIKDRGHGAMRYVIDYSKMPDAVEALMKELLEIEATGNRQRAENWFAKYGKMPSELRQALDAARDVPVDFYPVFSFPDTVQ